MGEMRTAFLNIAVIKQHENTDAPEDAKLNKTQYNDAFHRSGTAPRLRSAARGIAPSWLQQQLGRFLIRSHHGLHEKISDFWVDFERARIATVKQKLVLHITNQI